jgi:WD40 repeat protein
MRFALLVLPGLLGAVNGFAPAQERPPGHTSLVKSVALSHDGKLVLTGGDTTAILWEAATGKALHTFQHPAPVHSVSLSASGKLVLTGSEDGVSILWDDAGKKLHTLAGPKPVPRVEVIKGDAVEIHPVTGTVVLSGDGKFVVTASFDNTAIVWDTGNGKPLHTLKGHSARIMDVALSNDGKLIATGSADTTVILWDRASGKPVRTLAGHTGAIHCVSMSTDGKLLATGSRDGTAVLWETASGKKLQTFQGVYQWVSSASLSGDGKYLATAGGFITPPGYLWDVASARILHTFRPADRATVSGDGKYVLTFSGNSTVTLWETGTGKLIHSIKADARR